MMLTKLPFLLREDEVELTAGGIKGKRVKVHLL